jgi:hypothetical protein
MTPEMIAAGAADFRYYDPASTDVEGFVCLIYEAMVKAKKEN